MTMIRQCSAVFVVSLAMSACEDPPPRVCEPGVTMGPECLVECDTTNDRRGDTPCGLNGRGGLIESCVSGRWVETGGCFDDDECVDGEVRLQPCGAAADIGMEEQWRCVEGLWAGRGDCRVSPRILEFSTAKPVVIPGEWVTLYAVLANVDSCVLVTDGLELGSEERVATGYHYRVRVDVPARATIRCVAGDRGVSETLVIDVADDGWRQVTAGAHGCAINDMGALFCWGQGTSGQLGTGDFESSAVPLQEATGATDWKMVSASPSHTCAVKHDGRLFCWGSNYLGALGIGSAESAVPFPTQEASLGEDWSLVSVGSLYSCALKADGRLYCWGSNYVGQLGISSTTPTTVPTQEATLSTDWSFVIADEIHTCALKTDGRAFCWGDNSHGLLGDGTTESRRSPTLVSGGIDDWQSIATGYSQTCAIRSNGGLYCWGNLDFGPYGDYGQSTTPTTFKHLGVSWLDASIGPEGGCGRQGEGTLKCWTDPPLQEQPVSSAQYPTTTNQFAQLELGSSLHCGLDVKGQVVCGGRGLELVGVPYQVNRPRNEASFAVDWANASASFRYTCALKDDIEIRCWGTPPRLLTNYMETIDGIDGTAPRRWSMLATGLYHSCALAESGTIHCWGSYYADQGVMASAHPIVVAGGRSDWRQIAVGNGHTCALSESDEIYCWGASGTSLGNGSFSAREFPTQEATQSSDWLSLSAASHMTCGVKVDGRLFCWGNAWPSQHSILPNGLSYEPIQETSMAEDWATVSVSERCACAVKTGGRLFCWGDEECHARPDFETFEWWLPTEENPNRSDFASVSVGVGHICAVTTSGEVWCWGSNESGQLGLGHDDPIATGMHREATGVQSFSSVSVGDKHTCALKVDGRIACWGDNTYGQLTRDTSVRPIAPIGERTFPPVPGGP